MENGNRFSRFTLMLLSPAAIGVLGAVKQGFKSEADFGFSSLAVIVMLFTVWRIAPKWSTVVAVISALAWTVGELVADPYHAASFVTWANLAIRTVMFTFAALIVGKTRTQYNDNLTKVYTDELTCLYNRRYLFETVVPWLHQECSNKPVAVIYIDLDNFKQLNDTRGHDVGDEALRVASDTMVSAVRKTDNVIRMGGDEFVVILTDVTKETAERVSEALKRKVGAALAPFAPTAPSVGAAWFNRPQNIDVMLAAADEMMYSVKKTGRTRVSVIEK